MNKLRIKSLEDLAKEIRQLGDVERRGAFDRAVEAGDRISAIRIARRAGIDLHD